MTQFLERTFWRWLVGSGLVWALSLHCTRAKETKARRNSKKVVREGAVS